MSHHTRHSETTYSYCLKQWSLQKVFWARGAKCFLEGVQYTHRLLPPDDCICNFVLSYCIFFSPDWTALVCFHTEIAHAGNVPLWGYRRMLVTLPTFGCFPISLTYVLSTMFMLLLDHIHAWRACNSTNFHSMTIFDVICRKTTGMLLKCPCLVLRQMPAGLINWWVVWRNYAARPDI